MLFQGELTWLESAGSERACLRAFTHRLSAFRS